MRVLGVDAVAAALPGLDPAKVRSVPHAASAVPGPNLVRRSTSFVTVLPDGPEHAGAM